MAIIAISRQMGSGGYAIANAVAKALNYEYADRQMIMQAARAYDAPEEEIAKVAERDLSGWQRFDDEKLRYRTFLEAAYFAIAERDNVVTAGRGIASLLHDVSLSHALRVRIIAPFEVRVERVMRNEHLDHSKAAHRVREYDRDSLARISYLFGPEWLLPENYDLVINTVRDDPSLYADIVVAVASHPKFRATLESTQTVKDLSLAAQVRAAITKKARTQAVELEVVADKGHVHLTGKVRYPLTQETVEDMVKSVPGVRSVSCEAVRVSAAYAPGAI